MKFLKIKREKTKQKDQPRLSINMTDLEAKGLLAELEDQPIEEPYPQPIKKLVGGLEDHVENSNN